MSQHKPPRPELVPSRSKAAPVSKPQFSIPIPKPALGAPAAEASSKPGMQAFDVAVALATERLQSVQPQPDRSHVLQSQTIATAPPASPEPRPTPPRRNEAAFPVILIQQSTGLTLPTHTVTVFPRGAVIAVKHRLEDGSAVTIVNPANARSAEGTVLWCDGSSAEIEFREAIHTFWQPEPPSGAPSMRAETQSARPDVPPTKQSDVVSIAETISFPKAVELKLVPNNSTQESPSTAVQLFSEHTRAQRNVRPIIIALTAIVVLSGVAGLGVVMSKMHATAALPSLPLSLATAKADEVVATPVVAADGSISISSQAEAKPGSDSAPFRHQTLASAGTADAAVIAASGPPKVVSDAKEGPAPDSSSDFSVRMPAPPPVIPASGTNVVLAAPDPVQYTAAKPVFAPQPALPEGAKETGAQGDVLVNVEIDALGHVTATRARSGHPLLIEPAVSAARLWKFDPATRNGKPIASLKTLRFHFASH